MKFNWRSRKFFAALATVVCLGLGIPALPLSGIIADGACAVAECEV